MNIKKVYLLIIAVLLVLMVVSCGNQDTAGELNNAELPADDVEAPMEEVQDPVEEPAEEQEVVPEEPQAEEPEALPEAAVDGETLLNERCSTCHPADRSTRASKSLDEWESTIDRMIQKGAELSDSERDILAAYLSEIAGK